MARLEPIGRTLIARGSVPLPDYWGGMNDLAQVAPLPPPSLYMYLYMYLSTLPLSVHVLGPHGLHNCVLFLQGREGGRDELICVHCNIDPMNWAAFSL